METPKTSKPLLFSLTSPPLLKALSYGIGYLLWMNVFQFISLTLITYILGSSGGHYQDINDTLSTLRLPLTGLAAGGFLFFLRSLHPLTEVTTDEIITLHRLKNHFGPGFLRGALIVLAFAIAFIAGGIYKYVGFFMQAEDMGWAAIGIGFKALTLLCMVYCEEFIFRHKILNHLKTVIPTSAAVLLTALAYAGIKALQFDLGYLQFTTILFISFALTVRATLNNDFGTGAGILSALFILFHPGLSLPILGYDIQGLFLLKYHTPETGEVTALRFLTGGDGGPLSSFALQGLFLADFMTQTFENQKMLLRAARRRLR